MAAVAKPRGRKCQQKCYPLEPVLEDSVSKLEEVPRKQSRQCRGEGKERFRARGGFLSKLRDSYIKLMNDMASSADFTGVSGVSAVYGSPDGHLDFPGAAAMAATRAYKQDEEIEQAAFLVGASQTQKRY